MAPMTIATGADLAIAEGVVLLGATGAVRLPLGATIEDAGLDLRVVDTGETGDEPGIDG
jgi:hypothetical protein